MKQNALVGGTLTLQSYNATWLLWECFSLAGTGKVVRTDGKMNQDKQSSILEENMLEGPKEFRLRFTAQQESNS